MGAPKYDYSKSLKGIKFNNFEVIRAIDPKPWNSASYWLCKCKCGTTREIKGLRIRHPDQKSCGCEFRINLIGKRFGKLKVLESAPSPRKSGTAWLCKCDCGNKKIIHTASLLYEHKSSSCGCEATVTWKNNFRKSQELLSTKEIRSRLAKVNPHITFVKRYGSGKSLLRCNKNHSWKASVFSYFVKRQCPICMPKGYSKISLDWLKEVSNEFGINIKHARNGGEFIISHPSPRKRFYRCDGYNKESRTVYEFDGDAIHGNLDIFEPNSRPSKYTDKNAAKLYRYSKIRKRRMQKLGYNVVSIWASDYNKGHLYSSVLKGNNYKIPFRSRALS